MAMSRSKLPESTRIANARPRRRGVVTLELIVVTPIIAIMLSAVVEFGVILSSLEHVTASARAGAKVAAELSTVDLASALAADNVDDVQAAVDQVLGSAGMVSCMVILEHNPVCVGAAATKTAGACAGCAAPATALPAAAVIPGGSIRVTVCLEASAAANQDNFPNLLSTFGYDLSGQIISESITLPYENCP
ncbi:MAG: Flp pilus assembly protein TadG [Planctomycetaceae bacterium]|jgi:Flp pilus assembly protein TadG